MSFYIGIALALCGGFLLGKIFNNKAIWDDAEKQIVTHYRAKYNEQMAELCTRFRQERLALIHRYEGLTADIEVELVNIRRAVDTNETIVVNVGSNMEAMLIDEVVN